MSGEPQDSQDEIEIESNVTRFVDWATGRSPDNAPAILDSDVANHMIAGELYRRLGRDEIAWYLALAKICGISNLKLLESIIHESWGLMHGPLFDDGESGESERITSYQDRVSGALILLIASLSLGFIDAPENTSMQEMKEIYDRRSYDSAILCRFFSWAKEEVCGWRTSHAFYLRVGDHPADTVIFRNERGGLELRAIYAILQIIWNNPSGISLARRLIGTIPSDQLTAAGADFFSTRMDFLAELAKLDINKARVIGSDPSEADIIAQDIPEFNVTSSTRLDYRSSRGGSRTYTSLHNSRIYDVLPILSMENLERYPFLFGKVVALTLQVKGMPFNVETIGQALKRAPSDVERTTMCGVALLWADLAQLADYKSKERWKYHDQIRGVLARLSSHCESWPEAWVISAHDMLEQAEAIGSDGLDLLTAAGARYPRLRNVLLDIAGHDSNVGIRDHAAGMLARIAGVPAPGEGLSRWLVDSAARAFDGTPVFPRPLSSLAHTWIGSVEIEEIISRGIQQAMTRFGDWAKSQGAATEELVTGQLLSELETAFREASMRLALGSRISQDQEISVSQRPVTKTEEREWGCDIALLLNAHIAKKVKLQTAELIQIKKSLAFADDPSDYPAERWRIDIQQLAALLKMSQSAGYWLILSTGEILCVTARWIHGLAEGREALAQGSVTLGYNDLRHAAVPIGQYILEIFLGTWIGSIEPQVISFTKGTNSRLAPRYIFEVSITAGDEQR